MKTTLIPTEDRLIVVPDAPKEVTEGGIIIPDEAQEKEFRGLVVAAGEGYVENGAFVANQIQVGDRVLYGRYSSNEIKIDGVTYCMMRSRDIYAKILSEEPDTEVA
jgi:chaperonin GroES